MSSLPITSRCPLALNWLTEDRWRVQDVQHGASGRQQAVTAGADNAALEGVEDDVLVDTRALGGKQNSDVAVLMARRGNTPTSDQGACCASARILAHTCCCDVSVHHRVLPAHMLIVVTQSAAEDRPSQLSEQSKSDFRPAGGHTAPSSPDEQSPAGDAEGDFRDSYGHEDELKVGHHVPVSLMMWDSSSGCTRPCRAVSTHAWSCWFGVQWE